MTILEGTDKLQECELFPTSLKMYEEFGCQTWGEKQMKQKKNTQLFYRSFFFQFCFFASFLLFQKLLKNILKKI